MPTSYAASLGQTTSSVTAGLHVSRDDHIQPQRPIPARPPVTTRRITGSAKTGAIKAAPKAVSIAEKSVFGIYNVEEGFTEADIRRQCKQNDIKVLFCFDVTKENQTKRTFKLAIDKRHEDKNLVAV